MSYKFALIATLKNKRFWIWTLTGIIIYLIPVAIRYATGNIIIPLLNWPGYWIDHFIPGNLLEKIIINMFFPGATGAIAGEIFTKNYHKQQTQTTKTIYLSRLAGALLFVTAWSLFQYIGYQMEIYMSFSPSSNLFESYFVYPLNYTIATCSIFTPTIIHTIKKLAKNNKNPKLTQPNTNHYKKTKTNKDKQRQTTKQLITHKQPTTVLTQKIKSNHTPNYFTSHLITTRRPTPLITIIKSNFFLTTLKPKRSYNCLARSFLASTSNSTYLYPKVLQTYSTNFVAIPLPLYSGLVAI
ncbi:MAG: hypothetical protein FWD52_07425 [Candidatus Bathyarchaeota archaeon]|nr:hypothetical protein [Candidatus Termiticorpusculum sp.]